MTLLEGTKVVRALVEAYFDGAELVVELTGKPVILYTDDGEWYADPETEHLHAAAEITIKGRKRGDLL